MGTILIVDDMTGVRRSLAVTLSSAGHEIIEASSGKEGLSKLDEAPTPFDLVITDILMPDSDGIELINGLRERKSNVKILAISGGGSRVSQDDALKIAGILADAIMKKPLERDDILKKVDELLNAS